MTVNAPSAARSSIASGRRGLDVVTQRFERRRRVVDRVQCSPARHRPARRARRCARRCAAVRPRRRPPRGTGARGGAAEYGSPGIAPASTSSTAALSRTERVTTWRTTRPPHASPSSGPSDTRPRVGLRPNRPAHAGGDADRPAAVARVRERRPCPTRPPRRSRRSSRPGCGRGPTGCGSGRRRCGSVVGSSPNSGALVLPIDHEARGLELRDEVRVVIGDVADLASASGCRGGTARPRAGRRDPSRRSAHRGTGRRATGVGFVAGAVEPLVDDRVQRGIDLLDACDARRRPARAV